MSIELIALLSLFVAIAIGYFTNVNTGVLGIAMAFLVGTFLADMTGKEIIAGFPTSTFVTLMSMTFLFSIAKVNGTMETMAYKVIQLAKGKTKLIPHLFFVFAAILSAVGAGPIVTPALLCPIATSVGKKENIKDIIMLMCVICGGLVGGLTPFGPSGIVASTLFESSGIAPYTPVMLSAVVIHIVQYAVVFTIIGGWKIKNQGVREGEEVPSFNKNRWLTVAVILCVVLAAMFLGWDIALVALLGSSVLLILKASDQAKSIVGVPWGTLLLVGGVSVLINVINSVGGIQLLSDALSSIMSENTASSIICCMAGLLSAVSSASGVVMPTLIPTVTEISAGLGGAVAPAALGAAVCLGAHLVTCSPLSTIGALGYSAANAETDKNKLFMQQLGLAVLSVLIGAAMGLLGVFNWFL